MDRVECSDAEWREEGPQTEAQADAPEAAGDANVGAAAGGEQKG